MMRTDHTRIFLGAVGTTVTYVAGTQPPEVSLEVREAAWLAGQGPGHGVPTPSIRWWKDEVFGR